MSNLPMIGGSVPGGSCARMVDDLVAHLLRRRRRRSSRAEELTTIGETPSLRGRAQLVDAGDGVDRLLDRLGDAGLHLLDAGAAQRRGDGDDRRSRRWGTGRRRGAGTRTRPSTTRKPMSMVVEDGAADAEVDDLHGVLRCPLSVVRSYGRVAACWITADAKRTTPNDNVRCASAVPLAHRHRHAVLQLRQPGGGDHLVGAAGLRSTSTRPCSSRVPMRTWRS